MEFGIMRFYCTSKLYLTGKGLGKEESGISKAIKVNIKTDTAGVSFKVSCKKRPSYYS